MRGAFLSFLGYFLTPAGLVLMGVLGLLGALPRAAQEKVVGDSAAHVFAMA